SDFQERTYGINPLIKSVNKTPLTLIEMRQVSTLLTSWKIKIKLWIHRCWKEPEKFTVEYAPSKSSFIRVKIVAAS
ncbi:unnamed protein product, partial [marine sediment metagenome]